MLVSVSVNNLFLDSTVVVNSACRCLVSTGVDGLWRRRLCRWLSWQLPPISNPLVRNRLLIGEGGSSPAWSCRKLATPLVLAELNTANTSVVSMELTNQCFIKSIKPTHWIQADRMEGTSWLTLVVLQHSVLDHCTDGFPCYCCYYLRSVRMVGSRRIFTIGIFSMQTCSCRCEKCIAIFRFWFTPPKFWCHFEKWKIQLEGETCLRTEIFCFGYNIVNITIKITGNIVPRNGSETQHLCWRRICQMCSGDERVRELRFRATSEIEGGREEREESIWTLWPVWYENARSLANTYEKHVDTSMGYKCSINPLRGNDLICWAL